MGAGLYPPLLMLPGADVVPPDGQSELLAVDVPALDVVGPEGEFDAAPLLSIGLVPLLLLSVGVVEGDDAPHCDGVAVP